MRWIEPEPVEVPASLRQAVGGPLLLAQTLVRRGIDEPAAARAFLDPGAYCPAPAEDLPGLTLAAERLRQAIRDGDRIAVWGDFDTDGQTATALLWETLHTLGADVAYRVPRRDEGHGIHRAGVDQLLAEGTRLFLTCDTGTTAHEIIAHIHAQGAEVLVTDHHVPERSLPPALAVVNPHLLPAGHPMRTLSGVGVAYQIARALDPALASCTLDLVALGMVADVATLLGDTRFLVQMGLDALRHTQRPGLRAVCEAAELRPEGITEEHVGFLLGPRLNALGRLGNAARGVELLTTPDWVQARVLAAEVEGLNAHRQWLTRQVTEAAMDQIERQPSLLTDYAAIVLSHPKWPVGVVGIVAGWLAERFGKPAVLITTESGTVGWGSGRSVPGVDLLDALAACTPLLIRYGGHAAAAGLALQAERIPELRAALSRAIAPQLAGLTEPTLSIDAYVDLSGLTLDLVEQLNRLAPFGPGNPTLCLAVRNVRVVDETLVGRTEEHRRLTIEDDQGRRQTVFWWQGAGLALPEGRFDLAFAARASNYRGGAEVQLEWIAARSLPQQEAAATPRRMAEGRDCRGAANPTAALEALASEADLEVWAEGMLPTGVHGRGRAQLGPARRLAIWTAPPGPQELQAALEKSQAEKVFLFALDPGPDDVADFVARLAGLVKYALGHREGCVDLEAAASAMAHRVVTVQAGLDYLEALGQITVASRRQEAWQVQPAGRTGTLGDPARQLARLEALLQETAAYRAYVRRAPLEVILGH